jgi:CLIP-associating protein 1/2
MSLQALVVLWELIQHQWPMFDDLEDPILDALFRLRSCNSIPVS